ncbi:MAG: hypothetical protein K2W96_19220, partial [Gemmataceae bacterium]|nr:hypothetical protein [Gemmataceae bacterium]
MLHRTGNGAERRRGVILLVVLAMITLLAILGLSFVMSADATATSARIFREAQTTSSYSRLNDLTVTDSTLAWESFLGQLLYDVNDDSAGASSALRGHSLGRTMYGWNPPATGSTLMQPNDRPFTGTGRLAESFTIGGVPVSGQDMPNYTAYSSAPGFIRDPGRLGARASLAVPPNQLAGDLNVPYTFPDRNNMFLAMQEDQ